MQLEKNRNTINAYNQLMSDFKMLSETSVALLNANETKSFKGDFEATRKFLLETLFEDVATLLKRVREGVININGEEIINTNKAE